MRDGEDEYMIEYDFSTVFLTKEEIKIIKSAKNGIEYNDSLWELRRKGMLNFREFAITKDTGEEYPVENIVYPTEKAQAFLKDRIIRKLGFWLPMITSIVSLIVSIFKG